MKITEFDGEYRFLSNFWPCDITILGIPYKNVEAAYQAAKTTDTHMRKEFSGLSPKNAKSKGKRISLRADWNDVLKVEIMELCLRAKFQIPELKARLISTEGCELVEGNAWNDQFWGVCRGSGRNVLGKLLMMLRDEAVLYAPQYRVNDLDHGLDNSDDIPF